MYGLKRFLASRLRQHRRLERGAVAVLVTVVLGGGVMLGIGALVIDVGQFYVERADVQSSADAAAMAVARGCARAPGTCSTNAPSTAQTYANLNAKDGTTAILSICGTGNGMSACAAATAGNQRLSNCIGAAPAATPPNATPPQYVEVRTATLAAGGSPLLPPTFGRAVVGSSYNGTRIYACARAVWGAPNYAVTKAITISLCEWNYYTHNGDPSYVYPNPYNGSVTSGMEHAFYAHYQHKLAAGVTGCPSQGDTKQGGFDFVDPTQDNDCHATTTVSNSATAVNGAVFATATGKCDDNFDVSIAQDIVLNVAIYDKVSGTPDNYTYDVVGFAGFMMTGYQLSTGTSDPVNPSVACSSSSDRCLYGYFTTTSQANSESQIQTAGTYGYSAVQLGG